MEATYQLHGLDGGRERTISTTRVGRGQRRDDLNYTGWTGAEKGRSQLHGCVSRPPTTQVCVLRPPDYRCVFSDPSDTGECFQTPVTRVCVFRPQRHGCDPGGVPRQGSVRHGQLLYPEFGARAAQDPGHHSGRLRQHARHHRPQDAAQRFHQCELRLWPSHVVLTPLHFLC